jgi:hypothetical protein
MVDHEPTTGNEATADNVFAVAARYVSRLRSMRLPSSPRRDAR